MNQSLTGFWYLARCQHPACDWHIRTQVKRDFDKAVKDHKATH